MGVMLMLMKSGKLFEVGICGVCRMMTKRTTTRVVCVCERV